MGDSGVAVALADGRIGRVVASDVATVTANGGRVLAPEEIAVEQQAERDRARNDANTNTGYVFASGPLSALAGAANAATFGGVDYIGTRLAGQAYRDARKQLAADAPIADVVGGLAGTVLGVGKLASAVKAGAAAVGLGRVAATSAAAAAGAEAGVTAARTALATRALTGAARVGAEVAAIDAGAELSRQSLAGEPIDASAIARRAGEGLIGGAALGAALPVIGAGVRRLFSSADRVANPKLAGEALVASGGRVASAERAAVTAADDVGAVRLGAGAAADVATGPADGIASAADASITGDSASAGATRAKTKFDRLAAKYIESTPEDSRKILAEAWENRAELAKGHATVIDDATREFSKALDAQLEASRITDMSSFGESKIKQAAQLIDRTQADAQKVLLSEWLTRAKEEIEPLYQRGVSGMSKQDYKLFSAWSRELQSAIDTGDSLEMFTTADKLKKFIGKQARYGKSALGLPDAAKTFSQLYEQGTDAYNVAGIREALESPVWGDMGEAQKSVNAATARMISQGEYFDNKFVTKFGAVAGRPEYAANTSAINSLLNGITSASGDLDARAVREYVDTRIRFLDNVKEHYDVSGAYGKAIEKEQKALAVMRDTFESTSKKVELANKVKGLVEAEKERGFQSNWLKPLNYKLTPATNLRALASIEDTANTLLQKSESKTRQFVAGESRQLSAPTQRTAGFFSQLLDGSEQAVRASVRRAPTVVAGAASMRARYNLKADQIAGLSSNPDALHARALDAVRGPATVDPDAATAAATTAARGVSYLASQLPKSGKDPYSAQPQFRADSRASDSEISRFMRKAAVLDNPLSILDEAKRGTLTRDHVDAVKTVYPALYERMKSQIFESLVTSKSELPYAKRVQLSILLDIPTDKTLSPEFQRALQATYGASAESETPKRGKTTTLELTTTGQTNLNSAMSRL